MLPVYVFHTVVFLTLLHSEQPKLWSITGFSSRESVYLCYFSFKISFVLTLTVLQIKRDKRDNLRIILHIIPLKHTLWPIIRTVSTRLFWWVVTTYVFNKKNKKNYLWIFLSTPSYLELCLNWTLMPKSVLCNSAIRWGSSLAKQLIILNHPQNATQGSRIVYDWPLHWQLTIWHSPTNKIAHGKCPSISLLL